MDEAFEKLNRRIVRCKKCPRLIDHCQIIAQLKRRSYVDENYWGKPVPNFGDPAGGMLIVGLAPGAHAPIAPGGCLPVTAAAIGCTAHCIGQGLPIKLNQRLPLMDCDFCGVRLPPCATVPRLTTSRMQPRLKTVNLFWPKRSKFPIHASSWRWENLPLMRLPVLPWSKNGSNVHDRNSATEN